MQAANDEGVVVQRTWAWVSALRPLNKRDFLTSYFMRAFTLVLHSSVLAKELHVDLMLNRMLSYWTAVSRWIGAFSLKNKHNYGNLQPEIEINEYSSSQKLLE